MEQTNDIKELQEQVERLVDYNRRLSQENNLWYQLDRAARRILDDLWEWRWMIVLILVELIRLRVELDQRQIFRDMHGHVYSIERQIKNDAQLVGPDRKTPPAIR